MDRKGDAAELINKVRARNFADGKDPNPVTAANLDKYRLADEWMIEFLGESRRRTDLIRWGMRFARLSVESRIPSDIASGGIFVCLLLSETV